MSGVPTGSPIASDYKSLSQIEISGFVSFRIEAYVPTVVAIVLRVPDGTTTENVAWRYVSTSSGGEELLLSTNAGANWTANPTRKFSYRTFSARSNVIDTDQQTASVAAGTLTSIIDNSNAEFSVATLDRTAVTGDTVGV